MNFSSLTFIIWFLPVFLVLYYVAPLKARKIVLVFASLIFYAFGSVKSVPVLCAIILVNHFLNRWVHDKNKVLLFLTVLLNIGVLVYFKCSGWLMPGISFIVFQMIAFAVDRYRSDVKQTSFINYCAYVCMFPKLISGPITRYDEIEEELIHPMDFNLKPLEKLHISLHNIESGLSMFVLGLGYKVLIADKLSGLWNDIQTIGFISITSQLAWLGAIGYSIELYFDFQGYSLMAIGLGKMLGFHLPDNFNLPYLSKSVSEFYRRWHITLGRFFKDYVYIPLGGSRGGMLKTICNLLVVWLLTGLWHGFSWNFLLWGLILFVLITMEKVFLKKYLDKSKVLAHLYLLFVIVLSWVIFAIQDMKELGTYFARLFAPIVQSVGVNTNPVDYIKYGERYGIFLLAGIVFSLPWPERFFQKHAGEWKSILLLFIIFWVAVYEMAIGVDNPFMYFQF